MSPLLNPTTRNPSNLSAPKSSVVTSRKSPYSKLQSESRNLIWSDAPSSFPTMRCGGAPSATEMRIVPGHSGGPTPRELQKQQVRGVRSSTYLPSKDNAYSSVIFMAYGVVWIPSGLTKQPSSVELLFLPISLAGTQQSFCGLLLTSCASQEPGSLSSLGRLVATLGEPSPIAPAVPAPFCVVTLQI